MNPLGTRARVEELARLLDGAVSGPASVMAGHAALATRLRAVAPMLEAGSAPRPEFRAALRTRLVAVASVQAATVAENTVSLPSPSKALEAAVSWTQTRKAQRRIGVTAGAMAGVIAFTGVGIAASRSLPGAPFYGLKRGAESVQLKFAQGDTAKGSKHLEFAATRLREVRALAVGDSALSLGAGRTDVPLASGAALGGSLQSRINNTLADFDDETSSGRVLLERVYRTTGKSEPLRILKSFSAEQQSRLVSLLPELPAASKRNAEQSLQLVTEVGSTVNQLLSLGTCGGSCSPQAGGPTLPTEPAPVPGATASPTGSQSDTTTDNNVPDCNCAEPSASPEPTPSTTPSPDDTSGPSEPTASPTPSPTSSPSPSPLITILPSLLPTPLPTVLPTLPPILPTSLPLPDAVVNVLPAPLAAPPKP